MELQTQHLIKRIGGLSYCFFLFHKRRNENFDPTSCCRRKSLSIFYFYFEPVQKHNKTTLETRKSHSVRPSRFHLLTIFLQVFFLSRDKFEKYNEVHRENVGLANNYRSVPSSCHHFGSLDAGGRFPANCASQLVKN